MEVIIQDNVDTTCTLAASYVADFIKQKPDAVIGFATGQTTKLVYSELARMHKEGLDFSKVHCFNLDEFVGLPSGEQGTYRHFMTKHLFSKVNIDPDRIHFPDGMAEDIPAACKEYEAKIEKLGGIDLQILGIGVEGHIGFNEPTSSLASRTRIKTLAHRTLHDLSQQFESLNNVPNQVLTMGVGSIMDSKVVLLVATGQDKAEIIRKAVEGPITALVPASVLQMHQVAKFFLDKEAAQSLTLKPYYRWAFQNKPEWQRFNKL